MKLIDESKLRCPRCGKTANRQLRIGRFDCESCGAELRWHVPGGMLVLFIIAGVVLPFFAVHWSVWLVLLVLDLGLLAILIRTARIEAIGE